MIISKKEHLILLYYFPRNRTVSFKLRTFSILKDLLNCKDSGERNNTRKHTTIIAHQLPSVTNNWFLSLFIFFSKPSMTDRQDKRSFKFTWKSVLTFIEDEPSDYCLGSCIFRRRLGRFVRQWSRNRFFLEEHVSQNSYKLLHCFFSSHRLFCWDHLDSLVDCRYGCRPDATREVAGITRHLGHVWHTWWSWIHITSCCLELGQALCCCMASKTSNLHWQTLFVYLGSNLDGGNSSCYLLQARNEVSTKGLQSVGHHSLFLYSAIYCVHNTSHCVDIASFEQYTHHLQAQKESSPGGSCC